MPIPVTSSVSCAGATVVEHKVINGASGYETTLATRGNPSLALHSPSESGQEPGDESPDSRAPTGGNTRNRCSTRTRPPTPRRPRGRCRADLLGAGLLVSAYGTFRYRGVGRKLEARGLLEAGVRLDSHGDVTRAHRSRGADLTRPQRPTSRIECHAAAADDGRRRTTQEQYADTSGVRPVVRRRPGRS